MADWLEQLTSEHVRNLTPYESARRLFAASEGQQRVWLNANESPEAGEYTVHNILLNRYPDCQPPKVLKGYAQYTGLTSEQIVTTRGADEGIELLIRAFCQPAFDSVLICPPTYGMYAISAHTFNVGVEKALLNEDFSVNVDAVNSFAGKVKLVFLCSPNNPTGTTIAQTDLENILQAYANTAIVVLDEAYIEFSPALTQTALLAKHPHLVILRTLSKGFALAGIRCGFVLSSPQIKDILLKVIAPYPVPDPVAQIATQALSINGINNMNANVKMLGEELTQVSQQLGKIADVTLVGSQCGNFVLFKSPHNKELMQYLVENNVLIRDQSKQVLLDNCLRISIGTPEQNKQLMALIETFFKQNKGNNTTNQEAVL
ncbi:MAG: histidinol-phosphate aminotransferase [Alphaproteobacteria bacterium]|jgi:histidinol-phosphate aminotransferase